MTASQIVDILKQARQLLSNRFNWTRHEFATDYLNNKVSPLDPMATCFCALGAVCKVANWHPQDSTIYSDYSSVVKELSMTARSLNFDGVMALNDDSSHQNVLKMFDLTIERLTATNNKFEPATKI